MEPAGPAEDQLYQAVIAKFTPATFAREVAKLSGNTPATEKSAFYRYVRGESIADGRLEIYATVLGVKDASAFTREAPSEPEWLTPLREQLVAGVARFLGTLETIEGELKPARPIRKRREP